MSRSAGISLCISCRSLGWITRVLSDDSRLRDNTREPSAGAMASALRERRFSFRHPRAGAVLAGTISLRSCKELLSLRMATREQELHSTLPPPHPSLLHRDVRMPRGHDARERPARRRAREGAESTALKRNLIAILLTPFLARLRAGRSRASCPRGIRTSLCSREGWGGGNVECSCCSRVAILNARSSLQLRREIIPDRNGAKLSEKYRESGNLFSVIPA